MHVTNWVVWAGYMARMHSGRRDDIDGLRTIAVVAVIVFHAFPTMLPGGFVGVDVFFVISGYLITGIIIREQAEGRFSLVQFYARRARRIFPALSLILAGSLIAGWLLLTPSEYELLGKHVAGGGAFVANIMFMQEAGYFDVTGAFKPLLHLWSLGIEEQFYFLWPAILIVAAVIKIKAAPVAAVVALASFAYCLWLTPVNQSEAFYLPHARFWELMVGSSLAIATSRGQAALSDTSANILSLTGLSLVAAAICFVHEDRGFPAPYALMPVAGTALVIWAGGRTLPNRLLLAQRPMVWIGLISYPAYLWHWPLLSFPAIIAGATPGFWVRIGAVVLSFVLAALTYVMIEKPIHRSKRLMTIAAISSAVLFSVIACGVFVFRSGGIPIRPMVQHMAVVDADFEGAAWSYATNETCLTKYSVPDLDSYGWWFCSASGSGSTDVLIIGSSFANQYYPGIANRQELSGSTVLSIGACSPAMLLPEEVVAVAESYDPCTPQRMFDQQNLINDIIVKDRPGLVVVAGMITPSPGEPPAMSADAIQRVMRRIEFAKNAGAEVVVILPHLQARYYTRGCFARPFAGTQNDCVVPEQDLVRFEDESDKIKEMIAASFPDVLLFDPNEMYCNEDVCSFVRDGRPMFRDEYQHLSAFASSVAAELLFNHIAAERPDIIDAIRS